MAKTSDLLTHMEDADDVLARLDISGASGTNRNRAVRSLNRSQDLMERVFGRFPWFLSTVDDTMTTTAAAEFSALPSRTLRLDSLWFIDPGTSRPRREITPIRYPGGHRSSMAWPLLDVSSSTTGEPEGYWWAHGSDRVYWDRDPGATHTIRTVGFFGAADMTISSTDSTFAYADDFIMPIALMAVRVFQFRGDDDMGDLQGFADTHFLPVVAQMRRAWRHQQQELRGSFPAW